MAGIMADHNVEAHFIVLLRLWTSDAWRAVWESLQLEIESFARHVGSRFVAVMPTAQDRLAHGEPQ